MGNAAEFLAALTPDKVLRVYSGKPGCGCGCKGSYSESKGMVTKTLRIMRERASEVRVDLGVDENILSLEDDSRFRWLYFKAQ